MHILNKYFVHSMSNNWVSFMHVTCIDSDAGDMPEAKSDAIFCHIGLCSGKKTQKLSSKHTI